jgi:hypothetical protein
MTTYEQICKHFTDDDSAAIRLAMIDAVIEAADSDAVEPECPDCDGSGWNIESDVNGEPVQARCETCWGTGLLTGIAALCAERDEWVTDARETKGDMERC